MFIFMILCCVHFIMVSVYISYGVFALWISHRLSVKRLFMTFMKVKYFEQCAFLRYLPKEYILKSSVYFTVGNLLTKGKRPQVLLYSSSLAGSLLFLFPNPLPNLKTYHRLLYSWNFFANLTWLKFPDKINITSP